MRDHLALLRQRLSTCNYFLAGLALAVVGAWDEIKPLLVDLVTPFIGPDHINAVMAAIGILVILVRSAAAYRMPRGDH